MASQSSQMEVNRAIELHRAGRHQDVLRICIPIAAREPDNIMAHRLCGVAHLRGGSHKLARQSLERALKLDPKSAEIMTEISLTWRYEGDLGKAHETVDKALELEPGSQLALGAKAEFLLLENRNEETYELLKPIIESGSADASIALAFGRLCPKLDRCAEGIDGIRKHLQDFGISPAVRMQLLFRLGDLLDRENRTDEAFIAWTRANALCPVQYDPDETSRLVDRTIQGWSREALQDAASSGNDSEVPVFIVGMPRSGTTLVEHIIDAHPLAAGAGELLNVYNSACRFSPKLSGWLVEPPTVEKKQLMPPARAIVNDLVQRGNGASRVTDKLPLNTLRIGFIQMLFPKARVIHCMRDPMDIGLSVYKQMFASQIPWSYDMVHIGRMINDMTRLMDHWKQVADIPILTVQYEDVVEDQEAQTRRIIDFLGLEWDENCMRFYDSGRVAITASNDQVRRPIYRSAMKRYERYADHVGPLRDTLAAGR